MTTYRCSAEVSMTEVEDAAGPIGVLLHLGTRRYFTLNRTGVFVWNALAQGPGGVATLTDELVGHFTVARDQAAAAVTRLLDELRRAGLIEAQP